MPIKRKISTVEQSKSNKNNKSLKIDGSSDGKVVNEKNDEKIKSVTHDKTDEKIKPKSDEKSDEKSKPRIKIDPRALPYWVKGTEVYTGLIPVPATEPVEMNSKAKINQCAEFILRRADLTPVRLALITPRHVMPSGHPLYVIGVRRRTKLETNQEQPTLSDIECLKLSCCLMVKGMWSQLYNWNETNSIKTRKTCFKPTENRDIRNRNHRT